MQTLSLSFLPLKPYPVSLSKQNPGSLSTHLANRLLTNKRSICFSVRNQLKSIETSLDSNSGPEPGNGSEEKQEEKQKMQVVVKVMEKSRLVLKFIWMEKNIGLALDQVVPGFGTVPVTPYYFWPMEDAWEELKSKLEKPWISKKRTITLLNQATDLINLWQESVVES